MRWYAAKSMVERAILNTPIEPVIRNAWWAVRGVTKPSRWRIMRDQKLMSEAIRRSVSTDSNCIDIGCNKGHVLAYMLTAAPQGKHIAFEPIPELATFIQHRFPGVTVHNTALSDYTGESAFYRVVKNHGRSGLLRQAYPDDDIAEEITVPVTQLDALINAPVSLIKIDVEGAELAVLRGARQTISKNRPTILFEHISSMSAEFGSTAEKLYDELSQHGLTVYELSDWIAGRPALTREAFHNSNGNFVAICQ